MEQSALSKKMGIKPGMKIVLIGAPEGFRDVLAPLPGNAAIVEEPVADVVMLFSPTKGDLDRDLQGAIARMREGGAMWIAYLKGKSKTPRDLTRDIGWESTEAAGLEANFLVALTDEWSAFRFKRTGRQQPTDTDLLTQQFAGSRAASRQIYEQMVREASQLGSDVGLAVRKTYVALVRGKQFAVLASRADGGLDVGLKRKGVEFTSRFYQADNFGSGSITHKASLASTADIDGELLDWLRAAYEAAGPQ